MAEPAEDDVERLAEWAHLPGVTNVSEDRQVALNLLRHDVTLPPEPDTPAEPQERYYVGDGQSDNKVYERGRAHVYAETYLAMDADRIARLLTLDAKYEDGIEAEVGQLRLLLEEQTIEAKGQRERAAGAEARERELIDESERRRTWEARAKELEANLATARLALSHLRASFDDTYQRESEARAEIERLAALVREVAGAGVASTNRKYVEVQIDVDTWADLSAEISEPPAVPQDDGPTEPLVGGIAACEVCGAGGCDDVHEAPTEPLFTGGPMTTPAHYRRKPKVIDVLVWTGDNLDDVAEFLGGYVSEFSVLTGKGPSFRMTLDGSYGARLWVTKSQAWCDVNLGDGIAQETDRSGFYPITERLAARARQGHPRDPLSRQNDTTGDRPR